VTGDPRVAIRRKSDGLYLAKGGGHLGFFAEKPDLLKSQADAEMKIRIDMGRDLDEFEIVSAREVRK
jgi:hypothetical protein